MLSTRLTEILQCEHPVMLAGMGGVSYADLVAAVSAAGGYGTMGAAPLGLDGMQAEIAKVKALTDKPFGVDLLAATPDALTKAVDVIIDNGASSFVAGLGVPMPIIERLKKAGLKVMVVCGAVKHAVKAEEAGCDAVICQGGEGGGHTGTVPTTLLLPTVLDAVDIPVVAAGGFFDGRGLAAALSYGAAGIGMGTRFLLTSDSTVPDAVKQRYLEADLNGTVVTAKVDGMPHRMLRTGLVEEVEETSAVKRLAPTMRRTLEFKKMSGLSWRQLAADGRAMRKEQGRTLAQMTLAANTPMMLKAGLVEGDTSAGVLASGQVVGVIDDLPTCEELLDRVVSEAAEQLRRTSSLLT